MNRSNRTIRGNFRNKLLVGAIVAALALGTAGTSAAQTTNYTLATGPWTQTLSLINYLHSVTNAQALTGNVGATLGAGDSIFNNYSGSGQPQTETNNSILALAKGNSAVGTVGAPTLNDRSGNTIALELLGASGLNSGLGIGSGQLFDGSAGSAVTTNVDGVSITTKLTGYAAGTVTHSDNQIRSDVRVNDASNEISGNLPAASFAGKPTAGSANLASFAAAPATTLANVGDITIGNAQLDVGGATPSGVTLNNSVISVTDTGGATASFTNSDNTIAGSYVANSGSSQFNAQGANGTPSYAGSVVVSNAQRATDAPSTLAMQNDAISTDIGGDLTGSGSITQSGDTISAAVQGNSASNGIAFAKGINIAGTDPAAASTLDLRFQTPAPFDRANASGDLVLLNMQRNVRSNFTASITPAANSGITATANGATTDGSSVTLNNDHVTAQVGGNAADNTLGVDGASFDALVSVGSSQMSSRMNLGATTTGVNVRANLDTSNGNQGDISIGTSSIEASAQGNQATTKVDLKGTTFASGSGVASAITAAIAPGQFSGTTTNAGVSVGNVQTADQNGANQQFSANNAGSFLGANYQGTITDGASTVSGNSNQYDTQGNLASVGGITASAGVNPATTQATLSGTNGKFSAAMFNSQYTGISTVSGTVSDAFMGVNAGNAVSNATLTANTNSIGVSVHGNQATTTLSTAFTNVTLGDGVNPWANASSSLDTNTYTGNTSVGALALANSQWSDATTFRAEATSALGNGMISIDTGGNVTDTATTLSGNAIGTTAVANQANSTISPGIGNLSTVGNLATQVATLGNLQYANNNNVTTQITQAAASEEMIGAALDGNLLRAPTTVSGNSVSAFAAGNLAGNGIAVTGTDYTPAAVTGTNGYSEFNFIDSSTAAFVLQSSQGSSGGSRTASVANGSTGIAVTGAVGSVTDSALTVDDNQVVADARSNYIANDLSLSEFSALTTTAALQSEQLSGDFGLSAVAVSAAVSGTFVGAGSVAGAVLRSDVTVSGNAVTATGIGNTGTNTVEVDAGQLGGNSQDHAPFGTLRGAIIPGASGTLADYTLSTQQSRLGATSATVTGNETRAQSGDAFNGGSLTITANAQTARAQANAITNTLRLQATSSTASAALLNIQGTFAGSLVSATQAATDTFAAVVGGALGTATAVPVSVSGNAVLAEAAVNVASNQLGVTASSAINGTGLILSGATTDLAFGGLGVSGAFADFALYNSQGSQDGGTASATAGLVGIKVAGGGIGNGGTASSLSVADNQIASRASANSADNAIVLNGASSVSATTALRNSQGTSAATFSATTTGTTLGIYDVGANLINNANLSVSDNSLSASASGNNAGNTIAVLPTALNAGINQATQATTSGTGNTAQASHAMYSGQRNDAAINATVSNSNMGINSGLPGAASRLFRSVATVDGNSASASASGNSAGNQILLASLPTGVASSALVSNQLGTANIVALTTGVQIGVNAGTNSTTPVTVSGNTISAIGVGNSAMNHIGIGN